MIFKSTAQLSVQWKGRENRMFTPLKQTQISLLYLVQEEVNIEEVSWRKITHEIYKGQLKIGLLPTTSHPAPEFETVTDCMFLHTYQKHNLIFWLKYHIKELWQLHSQVAMEAHKHWFRPNKIFVIPCFQTA